MAIPRGGLGLKEVGEVEQGRRIGPPGRGLLRSVFPEWQVCSTAGLEMLLEKQLRPEVKGLKCQARELDFIPEAGKVGTAKLSPVVPVFSVLRLTELPPAPTPCKFPQSLLGSL